MISETITVWEILYLRRKVFTFWSKSFSETKFLINCYLLGFRCSQWIVLIGIVANRCQTVRRPIPRWSPRKSPIDRLFNSRKGSYFNQYSDWSLYRQKCLKRFLNCLNHWKHSLFIRSHSLKFYFQIISHSVCNDKQYLSHEYIIRNNASNHWNLFSKLYRKQNAKHF